MQRLDEKVQELKKGLEAKDFWISKYKELQDSWTQRLEENEI